MSNGNTNDIPIDNNNIITVPVKSYDPTRNIFIFYIKKNQFSFVTISIYSVLSLYLFII